MILGMLVLVVGACAQPAPLPVPEVNGTIIVYVTDAPPREEVTSIMVTLVEVQVHKASAEQEQASGTDNQTQEQEQQQVQQGNGEWTTIDMSGNTTFDLLQIQGIEQFLGESEVGAAKYTQVRLVVDKIQVRLGSGNLTDATLPSKELKLVHPFDVIAGETIALVIDFDADKMVTVTGAGKIIVKPVIKLTVRKEKPTGQKGEQETKETLTLEDTTWVLESYGDPNNLNTILEDIDITVEFKSAEGKIGGSAGCNSYFAGYEINKNELTIIPPIGSTMMACPEPVMEQERKYLEAIEAAESYEIEGGKLRIQCGEQLLIFNQK